MRTIPTTLALLILLASVSPLAATETEKAERFKENPEEQLRRWEKINGRPEALDRAVRQATRIPEFVEPATAEDGPAPLGWQEIGACIHNGRDPGVSYSGRVNVARYFKDPDTDKPALYLGTVGGGLWKAVNLVFTAVWVPISESLEGSPSVGDFAVFEDDPRVVLIGSGEAYRYAGTGIYRSDDAGATWVEIDTWPRSPTLVHRIAVSREDSQLVFIATETGLWRSEDFGQSGNWVLSGWIDDIAQDPSNEQRWLATRKNVPILESLDNGVTFDPIGGHGGNGIGTGADRVEISISESEPNFVYALASGEARCEVGGLETELGCAEDEECASENRCFVGGEITDTYCEDQGDCESIDGICEFGTCAAVGSGEMWGVFRSDDGGENWNSIDSLQDIAGGGQGFHAIGIAVDPVDADRVIAGMAYVQMTENATGRDGNPVRWHRRDSRGGCDADGDGTVDLPDTVDCDFPFSHPDYTHFEFVPESVDPSRSTIAMANDGGIHFYDIATNTVESDRNLLGLTISQVMIPVVSHAGAYTDSDLHYAGMQDNGNLRIDKTNARPITLRQYGDGGTASVHSSDPLRVGVSAGASWARDYSDDGMVNVLRVNCENRCLDSSGAWTDIYCFNASTGGPDDSLCASVGGTCSAEGLGRRGIPTVLTNQVSSLVSTDLFTHQEKEVFIKPESAVCSWAKIPSTVALPTEIEIRNIDMANNNAGRVLYAISKNGKLFVLDDIDAGGPGLASWEERTPDNLPPAYDFAGGQMSPARHQLQPDIVYYTTGSGRPSRAVLSTNRGKTLTWIDVTGSLKVDLPDADYWELVSNPRNNNQMFLATSVGVYRTDDGLSASPTWYRYADNMPAVVNVMTMELNANATPDGYPVLTIGTYGRGFWERSVRSARGGFIPGTPGQDEGSPLVVSSDPDAGAEGVRLNWAPSCATADGDYVVYEGDLEVGAFDGHEPVTCSTEGATTWAFDAKPGNRYFLIATVSEDPEEGTAQSVPGFASDGSERTVSGAGACFPIEVGACP